MTSSPEDGRARRSRLGLHELALAALAPYLALTATAATAEVQARMNGTQVELEATAAPLSEILDRLARLTGMKLVFEGAAPRPLVTISVHGRSPTQTVLAVLEGLGINFALLSDESGVQVQKLLVTGAAPPSAPTARGPSPSLRGNRNMPLPPEPAEEPLEDEAALADDLNNPGNEAGRPDPGEPPDSAPAIPANPADPAPQPYAPSPFLPSAPGSVRPLQPFPAPTPTAPPQGAEGSPPFSP